MSDLTYEYPAEVVLERARKTREMVEENKRLREAILNAIDCLERVKDGGRPYSLEQHEEVRLATEGLRAALGAM